MLSIRVANILNFPHAIYRANQPAGSIDRQDRLGLGAILGHACAHGFSVVVRPSLNSVDPHSSHTPVGGHLEDVVIARVAFGAGITAADTLNQSVFIDNEFDDMIESYGRARLGLQNQATPPGRAVRG